MPIKPFTFFDEVMSNFSEISAGGQDVLDATNPFPPDAVASPVSTGRADALVSHIQQEDLFNKVLGEDLTEQMATLEKTKKNASAKALNRVIESVADSSITRLEYALSKRSEISNKMGVLVHDLRKNLRAKGYQLEGIAFDALEQHMASYVQNALIAC
jgi:hypothetical protein